MGSDPSFGPLFPGAAPSDRIWDIWNPGDPGEAATCGHSFAFRLVLPFDETVSLGNLFSTPTFDPPSWNSPPIFLGEPDITTGGEGGGTHRDVVNLRRCKWDEVKALEDAVNTGFVYPPRNKSEAELREQIWKALREARKRREEAEKKYDEARRKEDARFRKDAHGVLEGLQEIIELPQFPPLHSEGWHDWMESLSGGMRRRADESEKRAEQSRREAEASSDPEVKNRAQRDAREAQEAREQAEMAEAGRRFARISGGGAERAVACGARILLDRKTPDAMRRSHALFVAFDDRAGRIEERRRRIESECVEIDRAVGTALIGEGSAVKAGELTPEQAAAFARFMEAAKRTAEAQAKTREAEKRLKEADEKAKAAQEREREARKKLDRRVDPHRSSSAEWREAMDEYQRVREEEEGLWRSHGRRLEEYGIAVRNEMQEERDLRRAAEEYGRTCGVVK